jgi:hypothetical protein
MANGVAKVNMQTVLWCESSEGQRIPFLGLAWPLHYLHVTHYYPLPYSILSWWRRPAKTRFPSPFPYHTASSHRRPLIVECWHCHRGPQTELNLHGLPHLSPTCHSSTIEMDANTPSTHPSEEGAHAFVFWFYDSDSIFTNADCRLFKLEMRFNSF